jgi:V/A-type H+-transporting ATPase subunit D
MTTDISPNRSELIGLKNKIKNAKNGHSLLKKKRDGLIMEFFKMIDNAKNLRVEVIKQFILSKKSLKIARVLNDDIDLKLFSKLSKNRNLIDFQKTNIMGLSLPKIKSDFKKRKLINRNINVYSNKSKNEVLKNYEELIEKIIILAEIETTILKLLTEIEKTKRRVNGIEFTTIPNLEESEKFVKLSLEEMERENIIRLKKVKNKIQMKMEV